MKGRRIGQIEISLEELDTIAVMTKAGDTRRDIANKVSRAMSTVWRYQKKLGLL